MRGPEAECILDVEARAVAPDHSRVGPQVPLVAIRILVDDPVDAYGHRQQAGDEVHQVHVMTANVSESV